MSPSAPLLTLLACAGLALAQQPPARPSPAPAAAAAGMSVRGLSFQLDAPPPEVFVHDPATGGKQPGIRIELKSYLNHERSALPITGDSLVFTKGPEPASLKDPAAIIAKTKLPAGFRSGILLFLPGTGAPGDPPFRVLPIGDTRRDFPPGSVKILNLSLNPVRIQLEKETFDFKSGETKVIANPPAAANHSSGMTAFSHADGQWRRIASSVWPHPGEKRVLQVLFQNPRTQQVEIRGIRDVAASPE